jgi:hypothetical protein
MKSMTGCRLCRLPGEFDRIFLFGENVLYFGGMTILKSVGLRSGRLLRIISLADATASD